MRKGTVSWSAWASALAFFLAGLFPLFNPDAYGHLAQGRQIVAVGRVPHLDTFSFWKDAPQPWTNYEWAYDLATWLLYARFGATALVILKCMVLAALGYLLVVLASRLARNAELAPPLTVAALLLALPVARFRFTTRPQVLGLLFPAILLTGIGVLYANQASSRRKGWTLAGLALLHLVWVNSHGSHLLGAVIALLFTFMSLRTTAFRWMLGLLALQVLATACTPFGLSIASDAVAHVFRPEYRELVVEWAPWSPKDPLRLLVAPIVASLFVLVSMRPVLRSSRFGLAYGTFCVLLSLMAFRSMRFVAHQLLFCAPFVAAGLAQLPGLGGLRRGVFPLLGVTAVACALWMAQMVPALGFGVGESKRGYPWASAEVIEEAVTDSRIMASIADSWFLMFAAPSARLLIDGRVPFYGPEMIQSVALSFTDPELFAEHLFKYDVNTVVIDHTRGDHVVATEYLSQRDDWALAFVEDGHSLFVRRDASPGLQAFEVLGAGYRSGRLLDSPPSDSEVRAEVQRIGSQPNTASIHAWHQGLEALRALARDGDRAGIRRYGSDEQRASARTAYQLLSIPAASYPGFTAIELYRAMAALSACDVSQANEALGRALYSGQSRGTSLVSLELALRAGRGAERSQAEEHIQRLQAQPETRNDPWVRAIAAERDIRCPGP